MSSTTDTIIYYSDDTFYQLSGDSLFTVDLDMLKSFNHYNLIIDDSFFFYETLEIEVSNKRKINDIIKNYLLVSYPEEMIQDFRVIHLDKSILVAVPSVQLLQFIKDNADIFRKVKKISTPFIEIISKKDSFIYKDDESDMIIENGIINHVSDGTSDLEVFSEKNVLLMLTSIGNDLRLTEKYTGLKWLSVFKVPAIILIITYLLFFAGEVLRIKKVSNENQLATSYLNKQYMKAGVAGKADPYGLLLFKAKGNKSVGKVKLTALIEKLGNAKGKAHINSFNYKSGFLRFDGSINNFTVLEEFTKSLESEFKTNVVVTDTKKVDNLVKFSIRIEL